MAKAPTAGTVSMDTETAQGLISERDKEITNIVRLTGVIIAQLGKAKADKINKDIDAGLIDIELPDEISGLLMTTFTCLRKQGHDEAGHKKYLDYSAKVDGVVITVRAVVDGFNALEPRRVIDFMVATPIVEIMTLFKAFFDEVRTGVTRFRVRSNMEKIAQKRDIRGVTRGVQTTGPLTHTLSQYGLTNHHIPLLQGITLAPERRTGVIRSLGPMTQALLLVMEDKFPAKLANSFFNSTQMLPMAAEITTCLREARKPGSVSGLLKELGDILLLTTTRSTQKMYHPLLATLHMWDQRTVTGMKWSFSGVDAMFIYNYCVSNGMKYRVKSGEAGSLMNEVIFHAIFGTYLDDLGICSQITDKTAKWAQRRAMDIVFTKRADAEVREIVPIKFTHGSKMAQSLLTKTLGNVDPVSISRPSFSDFRKRTFTAEFMNYLTTGKAAQNYSSDPATLQYALKKIKDTLIEGGMEKLVNTGTVKWVQMRESEMEPVEHFVPVEDGRFFFGVKK